MRNRRLKEDILFFCRIRYNDTCWQEVVTMEKKKQFVYVLKLISRLYDDNSWAVKDEDIVNRHFLRLKKYTEEGKVILAGRTLNEASDSFGLVIFEAESEKEAIEFMNGDPAVEEGIMTAKVYPYSVALMRKGE